MKEVGREGQRDGYVVVEAAVLLPFSSILILLLIYLGSYLYQGCFMTQAAYIAAFRGSRYASEGEGYVHSQLDELLKREVLSFGLEQREVEENSLWVEVKLCKETPFAAIMEAVPKLTAKGKSAVRDPVAYIRGMRRIKELGERYE